MVYAKFGSASTAMYCCDWWAWEALTFLAGGLRDGPELAAHVAASGASDWLCMVMNASSKAAIVLVGIAAGMGDLDGVWGAFRACAGCCAFLCGCIALGIWACQENIVSLLLPGEGLAQKSLSSLLPFIALQLVLDAANCLYQGAFSGLGRQDAASLAIFLCDWAVQLPLAWFLAHSVGLGVWGLRLGGCIAGCLCLVCNIFIFRRCLSPAHFRKMSLPQIPVDQYAVLSSRVDRRAE